MNAALILGSAALVAATATWIVLHYALRNAVLDVPNERSSHTAPTARGGGIAILLALTAGLVAGRAAGWIDAPLWNALVGGGLLIAGVGFVDDHRDVPAPVRAGIHVVAAVWALYCLGGVSRLRFGTSILELGAAGWVLGVLAIVWAVNLYNFMDGIDGIAASEAVIAGAAGGALALAAGNASIAFAAALTAAATIGFLVWNWAPARIFMGDVGSGLLGFFLAVIAIASETTGGPPLLVWVILLGVFLVDATLTLLRRMARRERWFAAHRSHAYQRAVQAGHSHARVTTAVLVIDGALVLLAVAAARRPAQAPLLALVALLLLGGIYLLVERIRPMPPRPDRSIGHSPG